MALVPDFIAALDALEATMAPTYGEIAKVATLGREVAETLRHSTEVTVAFANLLDSHYRDIGALAFALAEVEKVRQAAMGPDKDDNKETQ